MAKSGAFDTVSHLVRIGRSRKGRGRSRKVEEGKERVEEKGRGSSRGKKKKLYFTNFH